MVPVFLGILVICLSGDKTWKVTYLSILFETAFYILLLRTKMRIFLNRRSFHFRWFFHFPINDKFFIHKFAVALCCRENILNNVIQFRQKIWITFATSSLSTRLGNLSFSVAKKHKMVAWSLQNHDLRRKNSIWKVLILSPLTTVFASRLQRVT